MRGVPVRAALVVAVVGTATAFAATGSAAVPKPRFASYQAPSGMGDDAGEPTLGWHPKTGAVLYAAGSDVLKATHFDGRGGATWQKVTPLLPGLYTFDPILETDPKTGRTWTSQLDLYCSRMAYSDDAGANWVQVPVGCAPGATFDHQSVGVAKLRGPHDPDDYPEAVYYCAQTGVTANCGVSKDGGFTYGPATVVFTAKDCDAAFGHLKGAPDGTAYLPPWSCGDHFSLARTMNDGATWTMHPVPGSTVGDAMHPSLGIGSDGTVYYGFGGKLGSGPGGPPYVAVSRDRANTWARPVRVGADLGVVNTRFVTVVAGDGDRAAVSYLGTRTGGDASAATFLGEWHLYVSFTYDRGKHWSTVDATPKAPVQVGPICTSGALCTGNRNLLDFIDSVVDGRGRVLVAIADGCPGAACTPATRSSKATVVRQESGRGLLRKFD